MLPSLPSAIWKIRNTLSENLGAHQFGGSACTPVAFSLGGSQMLLEKGEACEDCEKLSLAVQSSAPSVTWKVTQQSRRETKPDFPISELSLLSAQGCRKTTLHSISLLTWLSIL